MICEACFEKLLVVIHQLPCLVLQITLGSSYELLVRVASILVIISFIVPGGDRNLLGHRFSPILSLPTRHFVPLSAAVVGTPPNRRPRPPSRCSIQKWARPLPRQRQAWWRCRGGPSWSLAAPGRAHAPGSFVQIKSLQAKSEHLILSKTCPSKVANYNRLLVCKA
jgi:hypothetical protein